MMTVSTISRQAGRRYPQMYSVGMVLLALLPSRDTTATILFKVPWALNANRTVGMTLDNE
jgi:hypothetical protein